MKPNGPLDATILERPSPGLPPGFARLTRIEHRFGSLLIGVRHHPAIVWVGARGFVTPALLREDLACAAAFGQQHPEGWSYLADIAQVRLVHPLNPFLLRRIAALPHLAHYVVIAPSKIVRRLIRLGHRVVPVTAVVASVEEALAYCTQTDLTKSARWAVFY